MTTFAEVFAEHRKYCQETIEQIQKSISEANLIKSDKLLASLDLAIQKFEEKHKDKLEFLEFLMKKRGTID